MNLPHLDRIASRGAGLLPVLAALRLAACAPTPTPIPTPSPEPTFANLPQPSPSATVALALSTTGPLPTPGPSATPIVHVVKAGDTLIGIAVRYGVTVEGIQALNGNIRPEALQPGMTLIIPPQTSDANLGLLPSPTPVPVWLGPVACYETPVGSRWCFVEARNPGASPIHNLSALVTLASADGQPIVTDIAYSALGVLPAGGSAPLSVWFGRLDDPPAGAVAQVLSAEVHPEAAAQLPAATVTDEAAEIEGRQVRVSGRVSLDSGAAQLVTFVLSLYNERGDIIGLRKTVMEGGLAAGEIRAFDIVAEALAGPVADYRLTIEAQP